MHPFVPAKILRTLKFVIGLFLLTSFIALLDTNQRLLPEGYHPRNLLAVSKRLPPQKFPSHFCSVTNGPRTEVLDNHFPSDAKKSREYILLLLLDDQTSKHGKLITWMLNAMKCDHKVQRIVETSHSLSQGKNYSTIIVDNYYKFLDLPRDDRKTLLDYAKRHRVRLIIFLPNVADSKYNHTGSALKYVSNQKISNARFSVESGVPWIVLPGVILPSTSYKDWTLFEENPAMETILVAEDERGRRRAAAIRDPGTEDEIEKIYIGHNISSWIAGLAFIDSVRWATHGQCPSYSLQRWIQVDIDDVFVGSRGTRIVADDVEALIAAQNAFRSFVPNFTFTLGYSGNYFGHGDPLEQEGDKLLLEKASYFKWFPHMWRHNHAEEHNESSLVESMELNRKFAEENGLPMVRGYAVSPRHAGVFPVYDALYSAWRKVWNIEVTSTEQYPHLHPASSRRGFIHDGIKVLPRQTCGLFTHTQFLHNYTGGASRLVDSIEGGELFWTVVLNPVSIFMTHQQNYAHDRLALGTFQSLFSFISCYTRLSLGWQEPLKSAELYFQLFPREKYPIWSNPCKDVRHSAILPPALNCSRIVLPNLIIAGPQKTGTTALRSFLLLHPNVSSNPSINKSFEEVQFFSGQNYAKGVEWYAGLFSNASVVVDKSATYMDSEMGAERAFALVPSARVVFVLIDPANRAWSWYQHLVARGEADVAALTIDDVIDGTSEEARKVRSRIVSGGRYAHHIERWLEYYSPSQILIVDGDKLRNAPVEVMDRLVRFLDLPPFPFQSTIKYSAKKKFFCKVVDGHEECLGASKGRHYPPPDHSVASRLQLLFREDNERLAALLRRLKVKAPAWLDIVLKRSEP